MPVIRVIEKWEGRTGGADEKGVRTLNRLWIVETDSDADGIPVVIDGVIAADPSAGLYASHPDWAWALRRNIDANPNGGPRVWRVEAKYTTEPFPAAGDGSDSGGNSSTPSVTQSNQTQADQRPPTLTVARKEVSKPLEFEVVDPAENPPPDPVPIANTLGDPFDPRPEVFRSHQVYTWKFHRTPTKLNWAERGTWQDTLNLDTVWILGKPHAPLTLRCIDYSLTTVWETGPNGLALFFELTAQAEYNPDGWTLSILNTGRRKRIGGSIGDPDNPPRLVAIVDDQGQPVSDPVPLTAAGVPVEPGGLYHYVEFDGYLAYNWVSDANNQLVGPGGFLE
jgi:hypothetical protein